MAKNKQKTRKSAAKRFIVTKGGKVLHRSKGFRHLKSKKNKKWLRKMKKMSQVKGSYKRKLLKMLVKK